MNYIDAPENVLSALAGLAKDRGQIPKQVSGILLEHDPEAAEDLANDY